MNRADGVCVCVHWACIIQKCIINRRWNNFLLLSLFVVRNSKNFGLFLSCERWRMLLSKCHTWTKNKKKKAKVKRRWTKILKTQTTTTFLNCTLYFIGTFFSSIQYNAFACCVRHIHQRATAAAAKKIFLQLKKNRKNYSAEQFEINL